MMLKPLLILAPALLALGWAPPQSAPGEEFTLEGRAWTSFGDSAPGVEVYLRQGRSQKATVTDEEGRFKFKVASGTYELEFKLHGFYETAVRGVEIRKQPLEALEVVLQAWLPTEPRERLVEPEKRLPAPGLEVHYSPTGPMAVDQVMTGTLTLKNVGRSPLYVPVDKVVDFRKPTKSLLRMNISLSSKEYDAIYNGWYSCFFPAGCRQLGVSETIDFPITLYKRSSERQDEPQAYSRPGSFPFQISVVFIPKGSDKVRTEPIQATYFLKIDR